MSGTVIPGDVYAWTAVFILPLNSALNPFLYTLSAILGKKVPVTYTCDNRFFYIYFFVCCGFFF